GNSAAIEEDLAGQAKPQDESPETNKNHLYDNAQHMLRRQHYSEPIKRCARSGLSAKSQECVAGHSNRAGPSRFYPPPPAPPQLLRRWSACCRATVSRQP